MNQDDAEITEADLDRLERSFPHAAGEAFASAFDHALAAGHSVVQVQAGAIVEISPDGGRRFVKAAKPWLPVVAGSKIRLR
ncbi:hypothetical protein TA3x_002784 [Tundrisphaera sp. TA3]|uniref:hypothetical protein n=1 Tax=Tundrisphaera sp. TA3 TaxID=3435775 RepID=UPI003EBD881A